ncbi:efflux transporter outer membrane subunit [Methylomagnum sp.]
MKDLIARSHAPRGNAFRARCAPLRPAARADWVPTRRVGTSGSGMGLILALALTGCAVGPDYQKPVTEPGQAFANAAQPEFKTDGADGVWWKQFNDPNLIHLIELAAKNNLDLKATEARLREARALFLEAGLNLLPHVNTHGNYTSQHRSFDALNRRNFVPRDLRLYNVGFDAFWEVDIFGRIRRNVESREAEIEAAEADRRDMLVSVVSEVARNYFELRGHQNQLDVARKNAKNQNHTLDITRAREEAGVGTELDTSRAKAQLDTTLATIPPIDALIRQDIHRISVLIGQRPAALTAELLEPAPLPHPPELVNIGSPADLLRRRPDIRAAERGLASATSQIGVATADLFPRVTFVGTFALESSSFTGLGAAGATAYNFGPRISWAAFDLGQVYARIKAADARAEASLAEYEQAVLNALEETENALVNYNRTRQRQALLASAATASEQAYRLAHMRFDEGAENFLTVLDTELRLLEDQRELAQSETATATTLVALYKALGGGWEAFGGKEETAARPVEQAFAP